MQYSEKQYSIESGLQKGRPLPDWVMERPEIYPCDEFYLTAFNQINHGDRRCPWWELVFFCDRHGLDEDNREIFISIIRELETEYAIWYKEKLKKEAKVNRNKNG